VYVQLSDTGCCVVAVIAVPLLQVHDDDNKSADDLIGESSFVIGGGGLGSTSLQFARQGAIALAYDVVTVSTTVTATVPAARSNGSSSGGSDGAAATAHAAADKAATDAAAESAAAEAAATSAATAAATAAAAAAAAAAATAVAEAEAIRRAVEEATRLKQVEADAAAAATAATAPVIRKNIASLSSEEERRFISALKTMMKNDGRVRCTFLFDQCVCSARMGSDHASAFCFLAPTSCSLTITLHSVTPLKGR
jgi:hypothetical protein